MIHFNLLPIVLASSIWSVVTNAQNPSFDEIIAADGNFSSLNVALQTAKVNLSDAYETGVTVFAPNNAAFSAYTELLAKYANAQYIAHLQSLLLMHVVEAEVLSTDLMDGQVVTAENKENITVSVNTTVTLFTADSNATVVAADVASSDGVLHQIDGVLVPSFISTGLIDLTTKVDGFEIVLELLKLTGLAELVGPELTATVFAPTDAAFAQLPDGALDYYKANPGVASILLSGHVISPLIIPTQNMMNGPLSNQTLAKTDLTIRIEEVEGQVIYYVNNATISMPNTLANNGIIHGIESVLSVPGAEYPPKATAPSAPTTPTATPPSRTPPTAKPPSASSSSAVATTYVMVTTMSAFLGWFMMA